MDTLLRFENTLYNTIKYNEARKTVVEKNQNRPYQWVAFAIGIILFGTGATLCLMRIGGVNGMITNGIICGSLGLVAFVTAILLSSCLKKEKPFISEPKVPTETVTFQELLNHYNTKDSPSVLALDKKSLCGLVKFLSQPFTNKIDIETYGRAYQSIFKHLENKHDWQEIISEVSTEPSEGSGKIGTFLMKVDEGFDKIKTRKIEGKTYFVTGCEDLNNRDKQS